MWDVRSGHDWCVPKPPRNVSSSQELGTKGDGVDQLLVDVGERGVASIEDEFRGDKLSAGGMNTYRMHSGCARRA